jgi:hypothetical protein
MARKLVIRDGEQLREASAKDVLERALPHSWRPAQGGFEWGSMADANRIQHPDRKGDRCNHHGGGNMALFDTASLLA